MTPGRLARWTVLAASLVVATVLLGSAWLKVQSLALAAGTSTVLLAGTAAVWHLLRQSEEAAKELEKKRHMQALGEMSAVLAHEIRNPLASLKGNAQLLAERLAEDSRERRKADRIVGEASRLEELCNMLLDFCRSTPVKRRDADPVALVREAADAARVEELRLLADKAPSSWPLDGVRLRQALVNVLVNARFESPQGAPVEVRVETRGEQLVIEVRDHGPGIPAGWEEQIFAPFVTRKTRGTGLGLAVARRTAELHGGRLTASSADDGGAVFLFEIARS